MERLPPRGYGVAMMETVQPIGEHLRQWRQRRRLSQLDLALDAEISARHLSFLETGRARPSREMVLRLAEELEVPLRERNVLLLSAGYAPAFPQRSLDDPALADARRVVETLLNAHAPFPALAVDRHWSLVAANAPIRLLLAGVAPALLEPPANVLRISFHPDGLAPRIVNLGEWRAHVFARLGRQIESSADPTLVELLKELQGLADQHPIEPAASPEHSFIVPLRLRTEAGVLDLITTTTVFGTPNDVTLSEIAIETFFPANPETAAALHRLSGS
jgi:transcriptional regulator with XRE-family HTH domain